ncbi:hypothetical protein PHYSODRAFT_511024 [Phytophthora sojae]|uniref:Carbohydrate esterase n=1 Tax=Phytophthora sojae (strain P6497) TaxID=1094619 RepID=G4ZTB2_PHYSP|nr:hypothetical protein PHYSODRAFT_511024 [Phytophthora sojae]EGZ12876.1 hypothetical protein PHYSODRAFT_511024 [Phytophthora sojae]|eukprot:XP_009530305.1 hypothetical protein PHYSODRAFT_511024 [Phytophthora sojae]
MVSVIQATKAAIALLALPVLATQAGTSTCEVTDSDACAIDSLAASTDDGSVLIYPGGDTRCAFDDYTDSVTTFASNSTYFFQVFPAAEASKKKLLLFFQGGGACVDKYTCDFALQCQLGASSLITTKASVTDSGIMNRTLDGNVFNDYNIVYLPYCTGDLFVGNKYLEPYESVYNQALGNKQCLGQDQGMYMNGYNNTMAVLKWALANYPDPEQLVIGGYSAGSLGAQMWSAYVAKTWGVESKGTKFQVLADSYVGVFPEHKTPASELINYYGGCGLVGFPDSMAAECEAETATVIEMVSSLMNEAPSAEWLFIDSIADKTQRKFYELVLLGIAGYPFTNLLPADEFYGNMTEILDAYSAFMNVTRFNIDSDQHVWLTGNTYESAVDLEDQLLGDVLFAWLSLSETPVSTTATPTQIPASTTSTPTVIPASTTATPTETQVPSTATPASTPATTGSSTEIPGSTTTTPTEIPASTTSTPTETPVSTTVAPTSTPVVTTTAPTTAPATTEPTVSIPTYC